MLLLLGCLPYLGEVGRLERKLEVVDDGHLPAAEDDRPDELEDEEARVVAACIVDVMAPYMQRGGDLVGEVEDGLHLSRDDHAVLGLRAHDHLVQVAQVALELGALHEQLVDMGDRARMQQHLGHQLLELSEDALLDERIEIPPVSLEALGK